MIGLMIIFIILLYLYLAYKVVKYVASKTEKNIYWILAALFFFLLPTWDVIIGKIYFHNLCQTRGGLKVYEYIQANGFLDKSKTLLIRNRVSPSDIENSKRFLDYGFKFYEVAAHNRKVIHFLRDQEGNVIYKALEKPVSKYEYIISEKHTVVSYVLGIRKIREELFKNIQNKNIVVQSVWLTRDGWVGRTMKYFIGKGIGEGCVDKNTILNFKYKLLKGNFNGK